MTTLRQSAMLLANVCLLACGSGIDTPSRKPGIAIQGGMAGVTSGSGSSGADGIGGTGGMARPPARPTMRTLDVDAIFKTGCARLSPPSELLMSNLLFVVDRSASMACNPPPTTDSEECEANPVQADTGHPSKWEITRKALSLAISALPKDVVVGLSYFSNDDACGVRSSPNVPLLPRDEAQTAAIEASLSSVQPAGATPLVGATILAYQHLHQAALRGEIRGNQFVVLITDGQQSDACSDTDRCADQASCTVLLVDEEVPKASGKGVGIKTFVIGAPGSEPARSVLSRIAKSGGTAPVNCDVSAGACHFDMTTQPRFDEALQNALKTIAGQALSCELAMPQPGDLAVDLKRINIVYSPPDGTEPSIIPKDDRAACDAGANGWQYADGETKIRLCGPKCSLVRAHPGARVDVVLGCPVVGPD